MPSTRFVVDRKEGKSLVLEAADGSTMEVLAIWLPKDCRREGTVIDVPLDDANTPNWSSAKANPEEEKRLRAEAERRLAELRKRDPGGDVEL